MSLNPLLKCARPCEGKHGHLREGVAANRLDQVSASPAGKQVQMGCGRV